MEPVYASKAKIKRKEQTYEESEDNPAVSPSAGTAEYYKYFRAHEDDRSHPERTVAMRAVIYARCSTEEESQKDALVNQVREAKDCVKRMDWMLVDTYIESRSGTTTKGRTEYNRLYDDLQKNLFDVIVIKSQDRLMRNTKDWYLFVDRLCTNGKKLYIYIENKFYSTDDALITGIKAILAEEYSRELSKKINNAHRNRQKNGGSVILTPNAYGFRKLPDKSIVLIEEEAQVKRRMYQLCADGYGSRTIANILTNEGIRKRSGKNFTENDILRIVRNPLNKGTVVMNKKHFDFESKKTEKVPEDQQFRFEHKVPATVSEELWQEANDEIDRRAVEAKQKGSFPRGSNPGKYNLSGKIICGLCGSPYYRRFRKNSSDGSLIVEWKCRKYTLEGRKTKEKARPQISKVGMKGDKGCDNIHLDEEKLFKLLEDVCVEQFSVDREAVIKETISLLRQVLEEDQTADKIQAFVLEENRIKEQQDLLLDKLLNGILSDEVYQRKQQRLENSLKSCLDKKKELEKQNIKIVSRKQRLEEIENSLRKGEDIERATVNEMLEEIQKIVIYPRYMEIIYNPAYVIGIKDRDEQFAQKIRIEYGALFDRLKRKEEIRDQVMEMIREKPAITAKEIAKRTGCSLSGAQYKLKVLKKEGRIRFNGSGGRGKWEIIK